MTLLLQSPLPRIRQLIAIVQASLSAYQHASETIALPLGKLLAAFPHTKYTISALEDSAVLTPVLVFPAMEAIVTDTSRTYGYVGLFVKDVYRMLEQARRTQQTLYLQTAVPCPNRSVSSAAVPQWYDSPPARCATSYICSHPKKH